MQRPSYIPEHATRVKSVGSLAEVFNVPFSRETNCVHFSRPLDMPYDALAEVLFPEVRAQDPYSFEHSTTLEDLSWLERFCRAMRGTVKTQAEKIAEDWHFFMKHGLYDTELRIEDADNDEAGFHHDGAHPTLGRALSCYNYGATFGACNEDVEKNTDFNEYKLKDGRTAFQFAIGDVWRHAGNKSAEGILPFIHSQPKGVTRPRLLLAGDRRKQQ